MLHRENQTELCTFPRRINDLEVELGLNCEHRSLVGFCRSKVVAEK